MTEESAPDKHGSWALNLLLAAAGLVLLLGGAHQTVRSGVVLARILGASEVLIGRTLVSVGTSLPELETSVFCAMRKETDLLVGSVIGSNSFHILCVPGLVGMVSPLGMDGRMLFLEVTAFLLFTLALLPFMKSGFVRNRMEGGILLVGCVGFIAMSFFLS